MKYVGNILFPSLSIMILVMLATGCNRMDERYEKLDQEAPMPDELHLVVDENKNILLEQSADIDIDVVITDGIRPVEEQNELYAEGRSVGGDVVTNARGGESYHNYGLAIDYALRKPGGKIIWDTEYDGNGNGRADWLEVAELAKDLGFEWGGDWERFPDYPHLQMDFDLSIEELQKGWRPADDAARSEAE